MKKSKKIIALLSAFTVFGLTGCDLIPDGVKNFNVMDVIDPLGWFHRKDEKEDENKEDEKKDDEDGKTQEQEVTSISLNNTSMELKVGASVTLVATVSPENATNKTVTWTSSSEEVATVSGGTVTALKVGETTITAKAGDHTATCTVTVSETIVDVVMIEITSVAGPTYIEQNSTLNPNDCTLTVAYNNGTTASVAAERVEADTSTLGEVTATAYVGDLSKTFTINVVERETPPLVEDGAVYTFKSQWTGVKNFTDIDEDTFLSCLELEGAEIITGYKDATNVYIGGNGGSGDGSWTLLDCLKIGKSSNVGTITLKLDSTKQFTKIKIEAIGARDDGTLTINEVTHDVPKKALKDDLNPIQLEYEIGSGVSELVLSSKSGSGNFSILITKIEFVKEDVIPTPIPKVKSVTVRPTEKELAINEEFTLTAVVEIEGDASEEVIWTSTNETVVSVDQTGKIRGLAATETPVEITATSAFDSTKSATCLVTVKEEVVTPKALVEITVSEEHREFNQNAQFVPEVVTAHYDNETTSEVTASFTGYDMSQLGEQTVTVSYTEDGVTKETHYTITVNEVTAEKGTLDNPYTVEEVIKVYKDLPVYSSESSETKDACFSDERVYVQGLITGDAPSTPQYTLEGGLVIYKPTAPTDFVRPCKGDVAIFEGYVEHYREETFELASNNINHSGYPTCAAIVTRGSSTISLDSASSANATVNFPETVTNASEFTFTVEALEGYQVATVKYDGKVLEGNDGTYTATALGNGKILVETIGADQKLPITISTTTSDLVSINGWVVSSGSCSGCYTSFGLDEVITVSTSGSPNCGSVWGISPNNDWRLYQTQGGDVTFNAAEGYKIVSIKLTFNIKNNGALMNDGVAVESGSLVEVDDTSITFVVDNTGDKTNGQVQIKGWEVIYIAL